MRKRIALVVTMFYEAGKCIGAMPCLLLQPVWTFILLMAFFMYWVIVLAYLSTSGNSMDIDCIDGLLYVLGYSATIPLNFR